ncbi:sulfate adenylyltransferase, large subunit [Pirellula staleyi DSM 6068]|uniref:Multifunctional fusion protein n=1 Tax=Pirellula staleyi (strain ATCC 27377 / DSM 6068 / ICPB 4128) TaxID=530564 RepID=D2R0V5_PIRSD|nr:sulfate adenylyltransferase subunit CysN [Pirellula staleyi]ADB16703.1 sulfate adenylyltransferase, large subunit [Pirellula staleyi DSM 6068]
MSHQSDLIATDILEYLSQHERKELMRFITCGSVDDGKSTLIGRLLYESKMVFEDHLSALKKVTAKHGTTGEEMDLALLLDGLQDEVQQGITIDVAYRYFSTDKRKFIIADTPGHEQYTRNMATGASTADLAIILIDARKGVLTQTKRHSFIVSLLGIKHVVIAINKMDLVDYSQETFEQIKADYQAFAARLDLPDVHFLPLSALKGENVVRPSEKMPWYQGSPLMHLLETVYIGSDRNLEDFRFPVQYVNRPNLDFRGFCGTVASGIVRKGDEIMAIPSRKTSRIKSIVTHEGDVEEAYAPLSITLTLEDEIDISRGDMIVRPGNVPRVEQKFEAMIVWMSEEPLVPGKGYLVKQTSRITPAQIQTVRYQVDVNSLHRKESPTLKLNEIGRCSLVTATPLCFDSYRRNRSTGAFIIIDRLTNGTVGAGMILDRTQDGGSQDLWDSEPVTAASDQTTSVSATEREARFGQKPVTLLLTGLTGSGKSSTAYAVERKLFAQGRAVAVLDGQQLRRGISKDLGFSSEERSENLRRGSEVARLFNDAGLIVIAAFLAPEEAVRQRAAGLIGAEKFLVVHLDAPLELCKQRDTDGQYKLAEEGKIVNFPGISAPYEAPANPDLVLDTSKLSIDECASKIVDLLTAKKYID